MKKNIRKYNLSNIMKRAWELVKKVGLSLSESLKKAWKEAKSVMEKKTFERSAKMVVVGREHYADDDNSKYMTANLWEKNGKKRIYFNDYKRRSVAYIDCITGQVVTSMKADSEWMQTVNQFMSTYTF